MIDTSKNTIVAELITAGVFTADNTPVAVDVSGARDATILIGIGAGGITFTSTNKIEFVLTHSDDGSTYEAVETGDVIGAGTVSDGVICALAAAHASSEIKKFGYIGNKKYLKLLADFSGTHGTGTPISACVIQSAPYLRPVA